MDKPETLATLGTPDTQGEGNKNTKTQHRNLNKKKRNTDPTINNVSVFFLLQLAKLLQLPMNQLVRQQRQDQ